MKDKVKFLAVLVGILVFCNSQLVVKAEGDFVDVPVEQINVLSSSSNEINMLEDPALGFCELGIGIALNGVGVDFSTTATEIASEIGCKNMVLQEKTPVSYTHLAA